MVYETITREETWELGYKMGKEAKPGLVYALIGDLGAGKTVFTKGFASGLGIKEEVNSPTFTILQVYEEGRLPFYHFDVYRIAEPGEMDEIGYEEYFFSEGVCIVEWANLIEELMPKDTVRIIMERDPSKGLDYRRITIGE